MTALPPDMKISAVASWYGSNQMLAKHVGVELAGCNWVGVPFAGGMSELAHIDARTINANDLHGAVINLARVMAHPVLGPQLYRRLRRETFHPASLNRAQELCQIYQNLVDDPYSGYATGLDPITPLERAANYFIASWMGRSGNAGTDAEFKGGLPIRWNASGGDSAVRFHNAVASIPAWRRILRQCNFTSMDAFDFLGNVKDQAGHGLYCDPPFPGPGDKYTHRFDEGKQRRLASVLASYTATRVVVRYYVHPLIEELYPRDRWTWVERLGRTQSNGDAAEVLIINGPSLAKGESR